MYVLFNVDRNCKLVVIYLQMNTKYIRVSETRSCDTCVRYD